jgi:hypothetical protein
MDGRRMKNRRLFKLCDIWMMRRTKGVLVVPHIKAFKPLFKQQAIIQKLVRPMVTGRPAFVPRAQRNDAS